MMRTEKEGFEPSRRVTDLHPFQGCPFSLLGTSPNVSLRYDTFAPVIFHIQLLGKQKHLSHKCFGSGEDGIRTHAPVKTNGFQDRPVMTTSVPLHILFVMPALLLIADDLFIISLHLLLVNNFFQFF